MRKNGETFYQSIQHHLRRGQVIRSPTLRERVIRRRRFSCECASFPTVCQLLATTVMSKMRSSSGKKTTQLRLALNAFSIDCASQAAAERGSILASIAARKGRGVQPVGSGIERSCRSTLIENLKQMCENYNKFNREFYRSRRY